MHTYSCLFDKVKLSGLFARMLRHIKHARAYQDKRLEFRGLRQDAYLKQKGRSYFHINVGLGDKRNKRLYLELKQLAGIKI